MPANGESTKDLLSEFIAVYYNDSKALVRRDPDFEVSNFISRMSCSLTLMNPGYKDSDSDGFSYAPRPCRLIRLC